MSKNIYALWTQVVSLEALEVHWFFLVFPFFGLLLEVRKVKFWGIWNAPKFGILLIWKSPNQVIFKSLLWPLMIPICHSVTTTHPPPLPTANIQRPPHFNALKMYHNKYKKCIEMLPIKLIHFWNVCILITQYF